MSRRNRNSGQNVPGTGISLSNQASSGSGGGAGKGGPFNMTIHLDEIALALAQKAGHDILPCPGVNYETVTLTSRFLDKPLTYNVGHAYRKQQATGQQQQQGQRGQQQQQQQSMMGSKAWTQDFISALGPALGSAVGKAIRSELKPLVSTVNAQMAGRTKQKATGNRNQAATEPETKFLVRAGS